MEPTVAHGLDALRRAVAATLFPQLSLSFSPLLATAGPGAPAGMLLAQADAPPRTGSLVAPPRSGTADQPPSDHEHAASSAADEAEQKRLIALVELARGGDKEAFGLLYDHYQPSVYRFLYYRVGSVQLAEDLTGDTFFRALRSMNGFRWQGKDFGAWLMTIARNLAVDHFKSGRSRLERTTEDIGTLDSTTEEGPEQAVLAQLTNETLMAALQQLPADQQECLVMRFLQGMSLADTAEALERSSGAVKQLQLRAVRNLAALMPEGIRG